MKLGPMSKRESSAARDRSQAKRRMIDDARAAFGDLAFIDNAKVVVWTRGQMNGVRATIKRLRLAA